MVNFTVMRLVTIFVSVFLLQLNETVQFGCRVSRQRGWFFFVLGTINLKHCLIVLSIFVSSV